MNLEFQLNEDDFIDAQLNHLRKALRRANRAAVITFGLIFLLAIIVCVSWFIHQPRQQELWPFVLICAAGVLATVFRALYLWSGVPYRRQFRKIKALQRPMRIVVNKDDVQYTGAMGESKILWTALEDWRESKKTFLLYSQPNLFFVVPKRAILPAQIPAFRELLKDQIAKVH